VRVQITPLRLGASQIAFNLELYEPIPFLNDGPAGINTMDHFRLPPDVTPDRVLLWYNYPQDARDRLLRINPDYPTAAAQEVAIQNYLGGPNITEEVRLGTVGMTGTINMAVFPMSIHPDPETAAEVCRRGCIDPTTAAPEDLVLRYDFLSEGGAYTRMRCCPISDLDSLPLPVVGKLAKNAPPQQHTNPAFSYVNPNPSITDARAGMNFPSANSPAPSTGSSTGAELVTWEQKFNNFLTSAETRINQQLTTLDAKSNQRMIQYKDALRTEIKSGQDQAAEQIRQIRISQEQVAKQAQHAEQKASQASEQSRVSFEQLQNMIMQGLQQTNDLRQLVHQTQSGMQQMQIAISTAPQTPSDTQAANLPNPPPLLPQPSPGPTRDQT
jgi:hypothetical protein